jgi:uncharacterized protein (DUF433 family)
MVTMASTDDLTWTERINVDPGIMGGMPVIKGTRVAVQFVVGALAAGDSVEDVCADFLIGEADVRAALAYATYALEDEVVHALPGR